MKKQKTILKKFLEGKTVDLSALEEIPEEDLSRFIAEVDRELADVSLCWDKGCRLSKAVEEEKSKIILRKMFLSKPDDRKTVDHFFLVKIPKEDLSRFIAEVDRELADVSLCWDKGCKVGRIIDEELY